MRRPSTVWLGPSSLLSTDLRRHPARAPVRIALAVAAVLTAGALLAGTRGWAVPRRVYAGLQVADVPASLWLLLAMAVVVTLAPALVLLRRSLALDLRDAALRQWSVLVLLAVGALVFNALVLAADSAVDAGPPIPLFHWAFTAVTALLAGGSVAARTDDPRAGVIAAAASGVVTLPLFALGWALYSSRGPDPLVVAGSFTVVLGLVPLLIALVMASTLAVSRRDR